MPAHMPTICPQTRPPTHLPARRHSHPPPCYLPPCRLSPRHPPHAPPCHLPPRHTLSLCCVSVCTACCVIVGPDRLPDVAGGNRKSISSILHQQVPVEVYIFHQPLTGDVKSSCPPFCLATLPSTLSTSSFSALPSTPSVPFPDLMWLNMPACLTCPLICPPAWSAGLETLAPFASRPPAPPSLFLSLPLHPQNQLQGKDIFTTSSPSDSSLAHVKLSPCSTSSCCIFR
ncbi:hypothetical protein BC827DRAFT_688081 [Russula dissimulans]|nr:hypothetical protein BC827DRAFT_688081 [Russula dissimulans]